MRLGGEFDYLDFKGSMRDEIDSLADIRKAF